MDLAEFLKLPRLPSGRRLFAHKKVLELAQRQAMRDLIDHVKAAIAHDQQTLQVELRRRGAPQARFGPEAARLDVLLDRSITGFELFLESLVRMYGPDHDISTAATTIRKSVLPTGAGDVTSLPYVQENEAVAAVLNRLAKPDMQPLLAKLPGTDDLIRAITSTHAQYHAELHKDDDRPSAEDLITMQRRGNEYLQGTVILILGHQVRHGDNPTIQSMLDAIRRQIADLRDARRRRRSAIDINPDTGESEAAEPAEPAEPAEK